MTVDMVRLVVHSTRRFSVLASASSSSTKPKPHSSQLPVSSRKRLPILSLSDLLMHSKRNCTHHMKTTLWNALTQQGYCFLTSPKNTTPSHVIDQLRTAMDTVLFPGPHYNSGQLKTSDAIYVSEKGIPMYRLGYELCDDRVREVFRIACAKAHDVEWPDTTTRRIGMRALSLLRHLCDVALDLLLRDDLERRDNSDRDISWGRPDRSTVYGGDFSMFYAMHYFNEAGVHPMQLPEAGRAVKAHVDPSLLVVEPYLCTHTTGLQVFNRHDNTWVDCDGPSSPVADLWKDHEVLIIFVGKALAARLSAPATLHRVVTGEGSRRTVIYEQKYEEFFSSPVLD